MLVYTSMYWYVPVHTSTYCLILTGECVYLYILLYTVTSKYISVHTSSYQFILKQTGTYQHIPKHTSSYLSWSGFKKDANGFWTQDLLHTVRMLSHCTARVQTPDTGCVTMEMLVSILQLCIILPGPAPQLCIILPGRRRSRSAPASAGHDVHSFWIGISR